MKLYVVCAVIFCAPSVFGTFDLSAADAYLHNQETECAKVSGASDFDIDHARKTRYIPDNQQMNTFSKCMLEKFNLMYSDGSINSDVRSYRFVDNSDYAQQVSEMCNIKRGRDAEDTARNIMICYLNGDQLVLGITPRVRT